MERATSYETKMVRSFTSSVFVSPSSLAFVLLLLLLVFVLEGHVTLAAATDQEVSALQALYNATVGFGWSQPWNTTNRTSVCGWGAGIHCNGQYLVDRLNLSNRNMVGTLPNELSYLTELTVFNVSHNKLSGTLPPGLGNASKMLTFDVSNNALSGTIPPEYAAWIILQCDLSDNLLVGTLPPSFGSSWKQIQQFKISDNHISGSLPATYANWGQCTDFFADENVLSGTLPPEYASMSQMYRFNVRNNTIGGTLPPEYGSGWLEIGRFDTGLNQLSGSIPAEYAHSRLLVSFVIDSNRINGTIPSNFSRCTYMDRFSADLNQLSGTLPPEFSAWGRIDKVTLNHNRLTGTLPPSYENWTLITSFSISNNLLTGTLPASYASWANVRSFSLGSNQLSGTIPASWSHNMQSFLIFDLSHNLYLSGSIPQGFRTSQGAGRMVLLSNNSLSGTLPATFDGLITLVVQDNANISGPVPSTLMVLSGCNTLLCSDAGQVGCMTPNYDFGTLSGMDYVEAGIILRNAIGFVSIRACVAPRPTPQPPSSRATKTPHIPSNDDESPPAEEVAALQTTAGVAVVNTVVSLASVDAADAQMLMSILSSPCMCSAVRVASSPTIMGLASSPFAPLRSDAWVVVGNVLLCMLLIALHCGALHVITIRGVCRSLRVTRGAAMRKLDRGAAEASVALLRRWLECGWYKPNVIRAAMIKLRFPNLSTKCILLLTPGVIKSVAALVNNQTRGTGDDDEGRGGGEGFDIFAIIVGIMYVVTSAWILECVAYRYTQTFLFIDEVAPNNTSNNHGTNVMTTQAAHQGRSHKKLQLLQFDVYQPHQTFPTVPRNVARFALPRGAWEPVDDRKSYGLLVSSWMKGSERFWMLMPGLNAVVQLLSAVGSMETSEAAAAPAACDTIQGITIVLLLCTMALIFIRSPHRTLLSLYFAAIGLVLTALTVLLGLLCRHDVVDSSSVSSFSVFVSCLMAVSKVYSLVLPFAEKRFKKKKKKTQKKKEKSSPSSRGSAQLANQQRLMIDEDDLGAPTTPRPLLPLFLPPTNRMMMTAPSRFSFSSVVSGGERANFLPLTSRGSTTNTPPMTAPSRTTTPYGNQVSSTHSMNNQPDLLFSQSFRGSFASGDRLPTGTSEDGMWSLLSGAKGMSASHQATNLRMLLEMACNNAVDRQNS